jgi:hypothetical protein
MRTVSDEACANFELNKPIKMGFVFEFGFVVLGFCKLKTNFNPAGVLLFLCQTKKNGAF